MNLSSTQIKDTYGNLVTIGTVAGTPTTGTLQNGAGSDLTSITLNGGAIFNEGGGNFDFRVEGQSAPNLLFVDASTARVGIGTNAPQAQLQIAGLDNATSLKISGTNQSSGMLSLGDGNSTTNNVGVYRGAAASVANGNYLNLGGYDGIVLTTGSAALGSQTERMRISSAGNVGIGTSTPATRLELSGDRTSIIRLTSTRTDEGVDQIIGQLQFYGNDSSGLGAGIKSSINAFTTGNGSVNYLTMTTSDASGNNTERLRITSEGYLRMASGTGGIQFGGDTAAANALDDYEEGTFTPVLTGSTSGTFNLVGNYTIIGNVFNFSITNVAGLTNSTKPVGNYTITGFPVAAKATSPSSYRYSVGLVRITFDSNKMAEAALLAGDTTLTLQETTSNALPTAMTDANFANASNMYLIINGSYLI